MIKIVLLLVKNVFFSLNEGISEKVCQVAQKHTAIIEKTFTFFYDTYSLT